MEFLLNGAGLRVDFRKTQGLFNKIARPNRYLGMSAVGSGANGSDLIRGGSNLARRLRILRLGAIGRSGWRRRSPEVISRGGAVPNFTGMCRFWCSGA
jgi:hypothetical protein